MIIIDGNHMAYRMLFASSSRMGEIEDRFAFFRHIFLTSMFSVIRKFADSNVLIAVDMGTWRKRYDETYKANRKAVRDSSDFDYETFFKMLENFWKDLDEHFPVAVVRTPLCEADDIFGTLAFHGEDFMKQSGNRPLVFVSSDGDMIQVKMAVDCIVYDPIKKIEVKKGATQETLEFDHDLKLMLGDKGDNISQVEKGVGPARATKILRMSKEDRRAWFELDPERMKRFLRNDMLISFVNIPKVIQVKAHIAIEDGIDKINEDFKEKMWFSKMITFYRKHGLERLKDNLDDQIDVLTRFRR